MLTTRSALLLGIVVVYLAQHPCNGVHFRTHESGRGHRSHKRRPASVAQSASNAAAEEARRLAVGQEEERQRAETVTGDSGATRLFSTIYEKQIWGEAGGGSGPGSSRAATMVASSIIRMVANKYDLHHLVDAPCGAFEWQPLLLRQLQEDFPGFQYLGVDVVPSVIQANKARYANISSWAFKTVDLARESLPYGYDLVLSRDAMQHMPCEDGVLALENLALVGAKYYLLGSYEESKENLRIEMGNYYSVNLRLPPFSLQNGVLRAFHEYTHDLIDDPKAPSKHLLLVRGEYLRRQNYDEMLAGCKALKVATTPY